MHLTVQRAALRLGVSPQTIRRWTASGLLPCTRTAGGHRRIREEDVAELVRLIGGGDHVAARQARERELEVLVETAIALASELEVGDLLKEIARRLTGLLSCDYCAISTYDEAADAVVMLADFDDRGRRLPIMRPYPLSRFPCTREVLDGQQPILVNVSDRGADAAEVAEMIAGGDRSLLMVPLVYGGRSIGLLELMDKERERRYSDQELRLCTAVAGHAAVALHNAQAFSAIKAEERTAGPPQALTALRCRLPELFRASSAAQVLRPAAALACALPDAVTCTARAGELTAGAASPAVATRPGAAADPAASFRDAASAPPAAVTPSAAVARPATSPQPQNATVHFSSGPPGSALTLVTSLTGPVSTADGAFLDLLVDLTAIALQGTASDGRAHSTR